MVPSVLVRLMSPPLLLRVILPPAPEPEALESKLPVVLIEPGGLVVLMFPPLAVVLPDQDDTLPVVMLPLAERAIAPPLPLTDLELRLPALVVMFPPVLVKVIARPKLVILPVVMAWLASRVIVVLSAPVREKPVVVMEPLPTGDRNVTGSLNVMLLAR